MVSSRVAKIWGLFLPLHSDLVFNFFFLQNPLRHGISLTTITKKVNSEQGGNFFLEQSSGGF